MKPHFSIATQRRYLFRGVDKVEGWLTTADKYLINALCDLQSEREYRGSIGEIGVHHGKLFILLYLKLNEAERAFCVDVFDNQGLNVDRSGKGDEEVFIGNLKAFADTSHLHLVKDSSLNVTPEQILQGVGACRIVSIDGGHTKEITKSDMCLCEKVLTDEGVIILDDCFNPAWPGVCEGVISYFQDRERNLVPFAVGLNKVFFCRLGRHAEYRAVLRRDCQEMFRKTSVFLGREIDVYEGYRSITEIFGYSRFGWAQEVLNPLRSFHHKVMSIMSSRLHS